jgi:hypothetical protein
VLLRHLLAEEIMIFVAYCFLFRFWKQKRFSAVRQEVLAERLPKVKLAN